MTSHAAVASNSCQCLLRDSWRCAVDRGLKTVACHCECHRRGAPAPVAAVVSEPSLQEQFCRYGICDLHDNHAPWCTEFAPGERSVLTNPATSHRKETA